MIIVDGSSSWKVDEVQKILVATVPESDSHAAIKFLDIFNHNFVFLHVQGPDGRSEEGERREARPLVH